jgi:ATP-dependent Clp protease ATP-binding subunit ClpA
MNMSPGESEHLVGGVQLHIWNDASVCQHIAEDYYDRDVGIRSLKIAVAHEVEGLVVEKCLVNAERIDEGKPHAEYFLDVRKKILVVTEREREDLDQEL